MCCLLQTFFARIGTVPSEVGLLWDLRQLRLHRNQLTGTIPTTISGLSNIVNFWTNQNKMTGTCLRLSFGPATAAWKLLTEFLHNLGRLPTELALMSSVVEIRLYDNNFSGQLPQDEAFWSLPNLALFGVGTQLTGTIPTAIGLSTSLVDLFLHNNTLTGTKTCFHFSHTSSRCPQLTISNEFNISFQGLFQPNWPCWQIYGHWRCQTTCSTRVFQRSSPTSKILVSLESSDFLCDCNVFVLSDSFSTHEMRCLSFLWISEEFIGHNNDFTGTVPLAYGDWVSIGKSNRRLCLFRRYW